MQKNAESRIAGRSGAKIAAKEMNRWAQKAIGQNIITADEARRLRPISGFGYTVYAYQKQNITVLCRFDYFGRCTCEALW